MMVMYFKKLSLMYSFRDDGAWYMVHIPFRIDTTDEELGEAKPQKRNASVDQAAAEAPEEAAEWHYWGGVLQPKAPNQRKKKIWQKSK
eukprot:3750584-Pyramimonas_sp.AAC.1